MSGELIMCRVLAASCSLSPTSGSADFLAPGRRGLKAIGTCVGMVIFLSFLLLQNCYCY